MFRYITYRFVFYISVECPTNMQNANEKFTALNVQSQKAASSFSDHQQIEKQFGDRIDSFVHQLQDGVTLSQMGVDTLMHDLADLAKQSRQSVAAAQSAKAEALSLGSLMQSLLQLGQCLPLAQITKIKKTAQKKTQIVCIFCSLRLPSTEGLVEHMGEEHTEDMRKAVCMQI